MRLLGRIRLSRLTDESTSEERQKEIITGAAAAGGHEIVGWAVDLDVSGSLSPFDTPELGSWLRGRSREFDGIAAWKLDRLGRTLFGLNDLFRWCHDNDKSLICVSDHIDLTHWTGRLVASVIAGVAEGELEAIKERTRSSHVKLRELGRWHGGTVPYGYKRVKRVDGWYLEVDEKKAPLVREIFTRVSQAQSVRSIADDFVERGVKSPRGGRWTAQTITRMIRARWPLGQDEHNGQVVLSDDGLPLQRAVPVLATPTGEPDLALWRTAQAVLDDKRRPKTRRHDTGLLLDVAFCSMCDAKLYQHILVKRDRGQEYRYWRCSGRTKLHNGCPAPSIRAEGIEEWLGETLMEKIGSVEVAEQVYVPGSEADEKLSQVNEAIETVRREKDLGLYEGDTDGYLSRLSALVERRRALESEDRRGPRWESRGTGVTYRERWDQEPDTASRRSLLLESRITVRARSHPFEAEVRVPLDVLERAFPGFVADQP
jgi:DNA invertase Pin-like site-specific DNA recombinase